MSDAFLLDTSVTSALFKTGQPDWHVAREFLTRRSVANDRVVLSTIALAEHESGFAQVAAIGQPVTAVLLEQTRAFYRSFEVYDFTQDTIEPYALIRAELFRRYATLKGRKFKERRPEELRASGVELGIEEKDLFIVATAVQYNFVLATFDDGPGIRAIVESAAALAITGHPTVLRRELLQRPPVLAPATPGE